jgi:hypothetical protein
LSLPSATTWSSNGIAGKFLIIGNYAFLIIASGYYLYYTIINIFYRPKSVEYSLSRNYQLNENNLSMSIIFPLDSSYAIIFGIYQILSMVDRYAYSSGQIDAVGYMSYYAPIMTVN